VQAPSSEFAPPPSFAIQHRPSRLAALSPTPAFTPEEVLMTIKIGDSLPEATFRLITSDGPRPVTTGEFFKGKKVVLFGLPGAFTPTCHKNHLPGFIANEAAIKAKGIDAIAMTSVNDPHVLSAWSKATGSDGKIEFLADGNADFAKAAGLEFDASAGGLGLRSKRYSMLVDNGVVKSLNVEDSPGKADISGADQLLGHL
jgi:peroxiredoxin